jgi:hypothetical protein
MGRLKVGNCSPFSGGLLAPDAGKTNIDSNRITEVK